MKKLFYIKKRGFTLIELLAVIVILAIILLVVMPIVLNIMSDVRKGAFESSAHGLVKTAENEYMLRISRGERDTVEYVFENGEQVSENKLTFSGKAPNNGRIIIRQDGAVAMGIEDGTWCIQKSFDSSETTTTLLEEMEEDCDVPDFVGTVTWSLNENDELVAMLPIYSGGDFEYSIDGETWQSSNVFEDLTPGVEHTFYLRIDGESVVEIVTEVAPMIYTITFAAATGGSIEPTSPEVVLFGGENTTPNAIPDTGYEFNNFTITEGECAGSFSGGVCDEINEDITIQANFTAENYTVHYQSNEGATFYPNYRTVSYGGSATTPDVTIEEGYVLSHYTVVNGVGNGDLDSETGNVDNVVGNMTIEGSFELEEYTISYQASTGGSVSPSSRVVEHGSNAEAPTATADTGYSFNNYTITSGSGSGDLNSNTGEVTNVIGHMTIQANFTINQYTVTYTASSGGSVDPTSETVDWSDANTGTDPSANTGYTFNNYTLESGSCPGDFSSATGICSDVREAITVRANFTAESYTINCSVGSGSGTTGGDCGSSVTHGGSATVTASPSTGYGFSNWSGDASGTSTSYTFTNVTSNKTATANFAINQYTVSYNANGGSCSPTSRTVDWGNSAAGPSCSRTGHSLNNYEITSGSCYGTFNPDTGACSEVRNNMTISANWTINQHTLSISVEGSGTTSPAPGNHTYNYGASVNISPTAGSGYEFSHWSGACSGSDSCNVTMTANRSVTAHFESVGFQSCGDVFVDDRDDNEYKTIQKGNQCWFQEDLRFECTYFSTQEPHPNWDGEGCAPNVYAHDDGLLYQWGAAMDGSTSPGTQGLCPAGWHIPTDDEWKELEMHLGMSPTDADSTWDHRGTNEGDKLKDDTVGSWCYDTSSSSVCGDSGFEAIPGGGRCALDALPYPETRIHWWTSSQSGSFAWERSLHLTFETIHRTEGNINTGNAIRCVKN